MELLYHKGNCDTIVSEHTEQEVGIMYHISNDKRATKSADLVGAGMLKCLEQKAFTEITVTDVQKASAVGRATFYRLFDNTADVLSYLCDSIFEKVSKEYAEFNSLNADETMLTFIRVWMENKTLLKAIADSNRMDFIYQSHIKYLLPVRDRFLPQNTMDETQNTYLVTTLTACTSAFLTAWSRNGAKESAEQLQLRIKECFRTLGQIFE